MKFCSHCGNKIEDSNAKFCSNCGAPLGAKINIDSSEAPSVEAILSSMEKLENKATEITIEENSKNEAGVNTLPQSNVLEPADFLEPFDTEAPSFESDLDSSLGVTAELPVFYAPSTLQPTEEEEDDSPLPLLASNNKAAPSLFDTPAKTTPQPTEDLSAHSFNEEEESDIIPELEENTEQHHKQEVAAKAARLAAQLNNDTPNNLFEEEPETKVYTPANHPSSTETAQDVPTLESLFNLSQEADSPPIPPLPPTPAQKRFSREDAPKKGKGKKAGLVFLFIIIFALATFGATIGMLAWNNQPSKTVDKFVKALNAKNYSSLEKMSYINGATISNSGWDALNESFSTPERVEGLKRNFSSASATTSSFPAVFLAEKPLFLFIKQYYVQIEGTQILIPNAEASSQLILGDSTYIGEASSGGVLYSGIFPGKYSATLHSTSPEGTPLVSPEFIVEASTQWQPNLPAEAETSGEFYTLTIENCLQENALLFLNDVQLSTTPENGVATLNNIPLNSVIKIVATENGVTKQAVVQFNNPDNTVLSFTNYEPVAGEAEQPQDPKTFAEGTSVETATSALSTFYKSYLEAINSQNVDGVQLSTEFNTKDVATRIAKPGNKDNTFSFISAEIDSESIIAGEKEGTPTLTFNATFKYNFKARDKDVKEEAGSNRQTVELFYVDGEWVVNRFYFVSDADFSAHKIVAPK